MGKVPQLPSAVVDLAVFSTGVAGMNADESLLTRLAVRLTVQAVAVSTPTFRMFSPPVRVLGH